MNRPSALIHKFFKCCLWTLIREIIDLRSTINICKLQLWKMSKKNPLRTFCTNKKVSWCQKSLKECCTAMWLTISFSLFFRLRLRRGERSTNYVYVSQGDWSLLSFDEKNRRKKKIQKIGNGNGCRSDTNYVYVSQEDFDEKNRKKDQKKTKK